MDPVVLLKSIFLFLSIFGLAFMTCDIGQRLFDTFGKIEYEFGQMDWYLFPIEIQRMLSNLLIGVQMPMLVGCFGIAEGSREQFKKVSQTFIIIIKL